MGLRRRGAPARRCDRRSRSRGWRRRARRSPGGRTIGSWRGRYRRPRPGTRTGTGSLGARDTRQASARSGLPRPRRRPSAESAPTSRDHRPRATPKGRVPVAAADSKARPPGAGGDRQGRRQAAAARQGLGERRWQGRAGPWFAEVARRRRRPCRPKPPYGAVGADPRLPGRGPGPGRPSASWLASLPHRLRRSTSPPASGPPWGRRRGQVGSGQALAIERPAPALADRPDPGAALARPRRHPGLVRGEEGPGRGRRPRSADEADRRPRRPGHRCGVAAVDGPGPLLAPLQGDRRSRTSPPPPGQLTDRATDPLSVVLVFVVVAVGAPLAEEIYFRGFAQRIFGREPPARTGRSSPPRSSSPPPTSRSCSSPPCWCSASSSGTLAWRAGRLGPAIWAHVGLQRRHRRHPRLPPRLRPTWPPADRASMNAGRSPRVPPWSDHDR